MKKTTLWSKIQPRIFTLSSLASILMLSQCSEIYKAELKTMPAKKGTSVSPLPKKHSPEKTINIDKSAAPIGFWTEQESGLYVSIMPRTEEEYAKEYEVPLEKLTITVGGPPNKRMNADDIFFISKYVLGKNKLTMTGFFNWDREEDKVELQVTWTDTSVEMQIFGNEKFTHYEAKRYVMKLKK